MFISVINPIDLVNICHKHYKYSSSWIFIKQTEGKIHERARKLLPGMDLIPWHWIRDLHRHRVGVRSREFTLAEPLQTTYSSMTVDDSTYVLNSSFFSSFWISIEAHLLHPSYNIFCSILSNFKEFKNFINSTRLWKI